VNLITQNTSAISSIIEEEEEEGEGEELDQDSFTYLNASYSELLSENATFQINLTHLNTLKYESISLGVISPPPDFKL
jgi:hypothetical protein